VTATWEPEIAHERWVSDRPAKCLATQSGVTRERAIVWQIGSTRPSLASSSSRTTQRRPCTAKDGAVANSRTRFRLRASISLSSAIDPPRAVLQASIYTFDKERARVERGGRERRYAPRTRVRDEARWIWRRRYQQRRHDLTDARGPHQPRLVRAPLVR
jgi:hypothetical protein